MLEAEFVDWLDAGVRQVRGVLDLAFGGLQLVLAGDMLQVLLVCSMTFLGMLSLLAGGMLPVPAVFLDVSSGCVP